MAKKVNMEEKKEGTTQQKLTYEQLKAYAAQLAEQANKIYKRNQELERALYQNSLREVEIALKCLDHADKFSPEFIKSVTERIELVMNPNKEAKEEAKEA
jgi:predicted transcriptional regulator